jgi:putative two-component system response regulator
MNAKVMVVDDTPMNVKMLSDILSFKGYQVTTASGGYEALAKLESDPPDLVLLDVMMPDLDGYSVCRAIRARAQSAILPVVMVTALDPAQERVKGLEAGADDFLAKPINQPELLARVRSLLRIKQFHDQLQAQALELAQWNRTLEQRVEQRTAELADMQDAITLAMASLAETRDNETGNHIRRTQQYVVVLAQFLQNHPRFSGELSDANINLLFKTASLHDIGKVGIPDRILLKPGKLDAEEFEIMKQHTVYGRDVIESVENQLGKSNDYLRYAREIAYSHQEKFDGSGYPQQLTGDAIPLSARLMAVADVYDALISRRVYKPPFSHESALNILCEGRGTHFDPDVIDALLGTEQRFKAIAAQFSDASD